MILSELIASLRDVTVCGKATPEITGVTECSHEVKDGMIFVAIKGEKTDGHSYICDAIGRGAVAVVVSRKIENISSTVQIISKNTRKTLAELCAKFYNHPERKLKIVGVTGTKGKSTTLFILREILRLSSKKCTFVGTFGILGKTVADTQNTTPSPSVLYKVMADAVKDGCECLLLEVSSQALKDFRLYKIPFFLLGFTGIGRDHIGTVEHSSFSDYLNSKLSLFTSNKSARAFINLDSEYSREFMSASYFPVSFGYSEGARHKIKDFKDTSFGSVFFLDGECVLTNLHGKYNSYNISLALLLAQELLSCPLKEIVRLVENISISGRFEIYSVLGRRVIIDYAHNGDSFTAVLSLARLLYFGRLIVVFGSVGGRGYERRRELARASEKYADLSVITTDNPELEDPYEICRDIFSHFSCTDRVKIIVDRREAIVEALKIANVGDTVMLLGKGHEEYMSVRGKRIPFSEREILGEIQNGRVKI